MNPSRSSDENQNGQALAADRFVCALAQAMSDRKFQDVEVFDVRGLSPMTDFFVIGTGTSERQIGAVGDELRGLGRDSGWPPFGEDADTGSHWVVVDFFNVVAHLFDAETRAYYDLESLWGDAKLVKWRSARSAVDSAESHR